MTFKTASIEGLSKIKISCYFLSVSDKCILDVGSQSSYATINCVNILKLKQHHINVSICEMHDSALKVKSKVSETIENKNKIYQRENRVLVMSKITDLIPSGYLYISNYKFPEGICGIFYGSR